jgi:hypothetical protein
MQIKGSLVNLKSYDPANRFWASYNTGRLLFIGDVDVQGIMDGEVYDGLPRQNVNATVSIGI